MKVFVYTKQKGQSIYLKEWIDYYKDLCFDGIIIHNNDDKPLNINDSFVKVIDKCGEEWKYQDLTKPVPHYESTQVKWSNEILEDLRKTYPLEECWMINIDIDEFLYIGQFTNIQKFIDYIKSNGVFNCFLWFDYYDDNNLIKMENKGVLERFTHKSKYNKQVMDCIQEFYDNNSKPLHFEEGKSLVEIHHIKDWICPHSTKEYFNINEVQDRRKYCIKHFYTKSLEEWLTQKILSTGTPILHPNYIKRYFQFNELNMNKLSFIKENKYLFNKLSDQDKGFINTNLLIMQLEENKMTDIFCTYHNNSLLEDYSLRESEYFHLFGTHLDNHYEMDGLGKYLNEYCTMYYVWKHPQIIKHQFVGFCHYRRMFEKIPKLNKDEIYVYEGEYSKLNTFKNESMMINGNSQWSQTIRLLGKDFVEFLCNEDQFINFRKKFFINDHQERVFSYKEIFIVHKSEFFKMMEEIHPIIMGFIKYMNLSLMKIKNGVMEKRYSKWVGEGISRRLIGYLIELYLIRCYFSIEFSKDKFYIEYVGLH